MHCLEKIARARAGSTAGEHEELEPVAEALIEKLGLFEELPGDEREREGDVESEEL